MNTSAVSNTAAAPNVPAARQAEATPDTMFNQVLSREMAEQAPAEAGKPAPSKSGADKTAPPAARTEKTASGDKPKSAAAANAADAESEEETIPATASAELLALVASLNQAAAPAADTAQPDAGDAVAGDGKRGAHASDAGLAALLGKRLAADAPTADERAPKIEVAAAPGQLAVSAPIEAGPDDFSAAIESASELRAASMMDATANDAAAAQPAPLQAALEMPQAAAQAVEKLMPKVGTQDWNQALGQKIVWMTAGAQQSASLTLNPPDLGPLHVVLHVNNNQATASFTAAQPEVRQALEAAMPKLREMLGEAGIQLGQANVGAGTPNHQQGGFGGRSSSGRGASGGLDDVGPTLSGAGRTQAITGGSALVDTFA